MTRVLKWILGLLLLGAIAGILAWALAPGLKEAETEAERARPAAVPSQVTSTGGQTIITMDADSRRRNGIEVETLKSARYRPQIGANAVVLPVQDLTTLRNNYLSANAQVAKAKAALAVSQKEYERLKQLYDKNQNVSAKAFQAAEGTWRSDESSLSFAESALSLTEKLARQNWGNVMTGWLMRGSPAFERILDQQEALLQVSLPPGAQGDPPTMAFVQNPDGGDQPAQVISRFPQVDPRLQSPTYLYRTPYGGGLTPGMTVVIRLPQGALRQGVLIPSHAVVWWNGLAWAYVETSPGKYARRAVPTDMPAPGGWFVTQRFAPGESVVTRGAEQLLAIESSPPAQAPRGGEEGGEGDKD